jgi:hypothetical protein
MSAEGSASVNSPPSTGSPSRPSGPPARRAWLVPALVVAVIAIVIVAALFATGTIRIGTSNSADPDYETFSQAENVANGAASSVAGGPWYAAVGVGVVTRTAVLEPTTNLSALFKLANCTFAWPGGEPANFGVPATPVSAAVGTAAYWTFGLKNASNGLLLEAVSDGVASALLEASGAKCAETVSYLAQLTPGIIDSPAIVGTVNQIGGSAFLLAHPNATMVWGVIGGVQLGLLGSTSPEWYVEYTSCTLPTSVGEVGATFNASVGGTSGVVLNSFTGPTDCELTAPTGLGVLVHPDPSAAAVRKAI